MYSRPLIYTLPIGTPEDRASTVAFNAPERSAAGVPFRWTGASSTIVFHAAGLAFPANRSLVFQALLAGSRPPAEPALSVGVAIGGVPAGVQQIGSAAEYRWTARERAAAPVNVPVTITSTVFSPPGDQRELGVAVLGSATLEEAPGPGLALPPVGAWIRWFALVGLFWALARAWFRRYQWVVVSTLGALGGSTAILLLARAGFWQYMHLALFVGGLLLLGARWPVWARRGERVQRAARTRPTTVLAGGVTILLTGQVLLATELFAVIGASLLLAGALITVSGASGVFDTPKVGKATSRRAGPWELGALASIVAIAAVARFYRLADIPYGLWRDEARHGLEALHILRDPAYRPVYIPSISLPGLFPLGIALDFRLFGVGVPSLRGFTSAFGVASTLMLYAVGRRLYSAPIALLAGFLYAVGSWRISIDRLAFDTAPTTFSTLAGFYAFIRALDSVQAGRRGIAWFGLSGLALALAVYGYYPGRFGPVVVALALLLYLGKEGWPAGWRATPGLLVAGAVAALTLSPLARFALTDPEAFFRRSGQVFLLAPQFLEGKTALEAVEQNLAKHAVMFNWRGEPNARHHAPGWPMLDVVTAAFFAVGLTVAVLGTARGHLRHAFVILWLLVLLVPSIVSVDAPSAVRAQDAAPAAYLLAAVGLYAVWRAAWDRARARQRSLYVTAGAAVLTLAAGLNVWLYFLYMPEDPRVLGKFYVAETRAGYAIAAEAARVGGTVVYLPRAFLGDEVLSFVGWQAPQRPLEAGTTLPAGPAMIVVPRGDRFAEQLAVARDVAARSGLVELGTSGDVASKWYAAFVRP